VPPARAQADALARAADLEAENAELRLVAGRRRAALTQSRRYLGAYLARSAAMLAEQQAALQGARPASEARAGRRRGACTGVQQWGAAAGERERPTRSRQKVRGRGS